VSSLPDDCSVSSFERVYQAERDGIRRLAYLLVRSEPVAEDLAQEAFLRLYSRFATVENPAGFLRTVVVRLGLTWRSRRDMEKQRLVSVRPARWNEMDELDETWEAIGRLRPERATVLVLRFYEDMTSRDIAHVMGCSAATARSRLRRALTDLRKELQ
jgi:RNA polymerase sigma factor (sigma-70 family)